MAKKMLSTLLFVVFVFGLAACAVAPEASEQVDSDLYYEQSGEEAYAQDGELDYQATRDLWLAGVFGDFKNLTDRELFEFVSVGFVHAIASHESAAAFLELSYSFLQSYPEAFTWQELFPNRLPRSLEGLVELDAYVDFALLAQWVEAEHGHFSWFDFISPAQLSIVQRYINIDDTRILDAPIIYYVTQVINGWGLFQINRQLACFDMLQYYDTMPFDENTDCPRRIMVRMHEIFILAAFEAKEAHLAEEGESFSRMSGEFGREMVDWRLE